MKIDQNLICSVMEKRNIVNDGNKSFNFQTYFEQLEILQKFYKCNEKVKYTISQWDSVGLLRSEHFCKSCSNIRFYKSMKILKSIKI